jgi:predicted metal-dependent hydrolase
VYRNVGARHVLIKHDRSLNAGFEMVTHPATLAYMLDNRDRYNKLCSIPKEAGFRSHDMETCGLHIHVGREWFTPSALATIGALTEMYWPELYIFSRRNEARASQWASRYFDEGTQMEVGADPSTAIRLISKYIAEHTGTGHDHFRFHTYNVCNDKTVEFRLFRGTLRESTFWASIQLIDNLVRFGREITDDSTTVTAGKIIDSHWLDIVGYKHYPELDAYNEKRVGDEWNGERELEIAALGADTSEDNIAPNEHVTVPGSIKIGRTKTYTWNKYAYSFGLKDKLAAIVADRPCLIPLGMDRKMSGSIAIFRRSALLSDIIMERINPPYFYLCTDSSKLSENDAEILGEILGSKEVSDCIEDTYIGFLRG